MDKKRILLKDIAKVEPFKAPEGYFENFPHNILSQIPDAVQDETIKVTLWHRVSTWVYMAAMFAGIALMIRIFIGSPNSLGIKQYASEGLKLTSLSDIEDFYLYYEDRLAQIAYEDAFYLTDFMDETDSE